jgi:hypothetical protein
MISRCSCLLLLPLSACITVNRPIDVAPAAEAEQVEFPFPLPSEGGVDIEANMAAAIQLALDDFLPWDSKPPPGSLPGQSTPRTSPPLHAGPRCPADLRPAHLVSGWIRPRR